MLTANLVGMSCPRLVQAGHVGFVDFRAAGFRNPAFVSMVRDPLERAHSHFVYMVRRQTMMSLGSIKARLLRNSRGADGATDSRLRTAPGRLPTAA